MDTFSGRPKTPCLNYSLSHRTACEDNVKRTEDELKQCKARIKSLKDEATSIENSLKTTTERHISDRLVKAKSKLRIELNRETDLEESIKEQLDSAQLELEKAIIRQAKLSQIEDEIFTQEKELECFEEFYAQNRREIEEQNAQNTIHKLVKKRLVKAEEEKAIELESANKKEESFQARQKMQHLIVESAKRHKRIKDQSRAASEKINNQRMESIRELKEDIRLNRENLKALEAKNIANEIKLEQKEDEKLEWLVKSGMDYIQAENKLRADQNQKMREKKKSRFEKEQKEALVPIVEKIVKEEKYIQKRKQQAPALFQTSAQVGEIVHREATDPIQMESDRISNQLKRVELLRNIREQKPRTPPPKEPEERITEVEFDFDEGIINILKKYGDSFAAARLLAAQRKNLIAPEFDGLWNQGENQDFDPEDDAAMEKVSVQTNRKVKLATDFVAKPAQIDFTDFKLDMEHGYTKKIQLTNVSYQISSIRFVSLSIALQDFCTVEFQPSGPLSPGISTSFKLTFRPALLQPISGSVTFSTPNGQFEVPVNCIPPRVDPVINSLLVDFGKQTVGEVIKREINLENIGATDGEFTVKLHYKGDESLNHNGIIDEISVTPNTGGTLAAKSNVVIMVTFCPKIPGVTEAMVEINVSRSSTKDKKEVGNVHIKKFEVAVVAESVDLPVSVTESEFDLGVITYSFMYQEQFSVFNSSNTAKVVSFSIPPEFTSMIELFPKTGYVQGKSSMKTHVKFEPNKEVIEELAELETPYYDPETGIIEVPVTLFVADQARPIELYVYGILTEKDLIVNRNAINFGSCTIYESVTYCIKVTNPTLLVQEYGFLDLPDYVSVRPGNGFGYILPSETIDIEIIFCATKAGEFKFNLVLQTLRNFRKVIECTATGAHPPLRLSKQFLNFATPLHDTHRNSFYITNDHLDSDEFKHPVPRIGTGSVFPTGPISFCFTLPENSGLIFSPFVGTVLPGESRFITVMCNPELSDSEITTLVRSLHLKSDREEEGQSLEKQTSRAQLSGQESNSVLKSVGRKRSVAQLKRKKSDANNNFKVNKNSKLFWTARDKLTRNFNPTEDTLNIPCFITAGSIVDQTCREDYRVENCLWLNIHIKRLRPAIVVKNFNGKPAVDFGSAPIGEVEKRTLLVENISENEVVMKSSLLDPHGPFQLLNPLGEIEPGETQFLLLNFSPSSDKVYHEVLQVNQSSDDWDDHEATLNISLTGQGLRPTCQLLVKDMVIDQPLDLGVVQPGDTAEQMITLKNTSMFDIKFRIFHDSEKDQLLANNRNGRVLFDCSPSFGKVGMGDEIKLRVRFTPDHAGMFHDVLRLRLFGKDYEQVELVGRAIANTVYLSNVEYSSLRLGAGAGYSTSDFTRTESSVVSEPVVVVLEKKSEEMNSVYTAKIDVIAIQLSTKKKFDYFLESVFEEINLEDLSWMTISPGLSGQIDSGTRQNVTFQFDILPPSHQMIRMKLVGDIVSEYDLYFTTKNFKRDSEQFHPRIQQQHKKFFKELYRK